MYPSLSSPQTHRHSHTTPPPDPVSALGTPWRPDGSPDTNRDVTTSWTSSHQCDPSRDNSADPVLLSRTLSYPQESLFTAEMPLSPHGTTPQREGSVFAQQSVMPNCAPLATRPHVCERDVNKAEACSRRVCGQYLEQECWGGKAGRSPSAGEQVVGTQAHQAAGGGGGGWGHVCDGVSNPRYHIQYNQPCTPSNQHHHHYHSLPLHNLCCPRCRDPHPHHRHHHSRRPHRSQVLSSKLCSPGLVLLVLLLLLLMLLLLMLLLVLRATVSQHRGQVTERQKGEGSKVRVRHYSTAWGILEEEEEEKEEESTGEVLPGTISLLPHLPAHYRAHAHALTVHQPDRYDPERDVWSFPSLQQRDKTVDKTEIFLHSSVDQFLLTLHLANDSEASSHTLSLVKDSLQNLPGDGARSRLSSYVPSRRFTPSTGRTWVVADVTQYLRQWLRSRSEFSVEVRRSERTDVAVGGGRRLLHQQQQRGSSILQPVVCVQGHETGRSKDEDYLRMVVRRRVLAWKAREVVTWRPFGGTEGGTTVPDDATSAGASTTGDRRRREASTECQVSRLVVSLEDLGLRQVVYPTTLFLNYCRGSCHILDHPGVFSTNALLRAKYKFLHGSGQVPAPHCTPVQYQEQLLFVWREGHLTMIRVDDLDATSCGCR